MKIYLRAVSPLQQYRFLSLASEIVSEKPSRIATAIMNLGSQVEEGQEVHVAVEYDVEAPEDSGLSMRVQVSKFTITRRDEKIKVEDHEFMPMEEFLSLQEHTKKIVVEVWESIKHETREDDHERADDQQPDREPEPTSHGA